MNHPISPIMHSEAGSGLSADILGAFIQHLHLAGLSASHICADRRGARHFLIWLDLCGIALESVDDAVLCAFRRHDCHCPGMERERHMMRRSNKRGFLTGALKLVQFQEDQGCIPHPGELDANLRHLDDFLARCTEEGFRPDTLSGYKSSCHHILIWLHRSRISITDVDAETLECFLHHDCVCPGSGKGLRQRVCHTRYESPFLSFLQYLSATGMVSVWNMTPEQEPDPAIAPFETWLRHHRGIGDKTIQNHSGHAAMLIAALGPDPRSYDAAGIREVLLRHYAGVSRSQARHLACSMRMYLRYLATTGRCSPFLVDAVPTATTWRLTSLPRYIGPEQVEHVIACCDVTRPAGLRDRAILLLLARLALRAGDIVALRLEDIDWRNALVRVCGKSRHQEALPLPQDAGDAILEYVEKARPRVGKDRIFLTARAPYRPLRSGSHITSIVANALKRAGLEDVRPQGAYLFRHSAATNMLRSGQSLEIISALLRHKSMDTTTIYAKTDTSMLLEVAQPWIGDPS